MNKKRLFAIALILLVVLSLAIYYFSHHTIAVLEPRGPIALKERNLFLVVLGLMLIVVLPVFIITFIVVYKYRDGHHGKYKPEFDHSVFLESTWWLIPTVLITAIAVITWKASYALDPYRPIASKESTVNIQVIALDWKWLFIYPQNKIATINDLVIPVNHPIHFNLTADAPMNSFWIPQLSGQIYAMAGMSGQLNLMATIVGSYYGSSANISGSGFASMHFAARAVSDSSYIAWTAQVARSKQTLTNSMYNSLSKPSSNSQISYFKNPSPNLFASVINKYMTPGMANPNMIMGMN